MNERRRHADRIRVFFTLINRCNYVRKLSLEMVLEHDELHSFAAWKIFVKACDQSRS